jgi:hypothetical protein
VPDTAWFEEVSGVVESRDEPGVLWTVADSGNAAEVVAIDLAGHELGRFELSSLAGATNVDWEDLAIGAGPGGGDHLYVADIGDNGPSNLDDEDSVRPSVTIYRLPEPEVDLGDDLGTVTVAADAVDEIVATYPDGPDAGAAPDRQDAETLIVDPLTGGLLVVTKRIFSPARVYELSAPLTGGPTEMTAVGTVTDPAAIWLTGGDVSADGSQVLLRSYGGAFLWHRGAGEPLAEVFAAEPCPLVVGDAGLSENQGEAIAFTGGTAGYVTISERGAGDEPKEIWTVDAACELPGITPNTFPDVPVAFDEGVSWLSCFGITTGYEDGTFRPAGTANRQQVAAYLHRFFDRPPAPGPPDFSDVAADHAFAAEISWLASTGITTGYADGTFGPNRLVTRAQAAAFLYRAAGSPAVPAGGPTFPDVGSRQPFRDEIRWMAQQALAAGYLDGTFRPGAPVSRGALATFLFRLASTDAAWDPAAAVPSAALF